MLASAVDFKSCGVSGQLVQPRGVWFFGERKRISVAIARRIFVVLRGDGRFNAASWFAVLRMVRRSSFRAVVSVFQSSSFRRSLRLTIRPSRPLTRRLNSGVRCAMQSVNFGGTERERLEISVSGYERAVTGDYDVTTGSLH